LEWATSCPPPRHNFTSLPRIRSESPAFDLHHPEVVAMERPEYNRGVLDSIYGEGSPRGQETRAGQRVVDEETAPEQEGASGR